MEPDYKYKGIAEGIAAFGRNGDTMLMHVNPAEVAALESLAPGSITTNPDTGQPEAFFWLLPAILAALPGAGGAGLTGLAGAMSGAVGGGTLGSVVGAIPAAAGSALTGASSSLGGLAGALGAPAGVVANVTPVATAGGLAPAGAGVGAGAGGGAGLGGGIGSAGAVPGGGLGGTAAPSLNAAVGEAITAGAEGLGSLASSAVMGPVDTVAGGIEGITGALTGGAPVGSVAPVGAPPPPVVTPPPVMPAGLPVMPTPPAGLDLAAQAAQVNMPVMPSVPNVNLAQAGNIPTLPQGLPAPPPGPSLPGGLGSPDLSGLLNQAPTFDPLAATPDAVRAGIQAPQQLAAQHVPGTISDIGSGIYSPIEGVAEGLSGASDLADLGLSNPWPQPVGVSVDGAIPGTTPLGTTPTALSNAPAVAESGSTLGRVGGQIREGMGRIYNTVEKALVGEGAPEITELQRATAAMEGNPIPLANTSPPWAQTWQEGGLRGVAGRVGGGLADVDPMLLLGGAYMLDKQLQDPGEVPEWAKKKTGSDNVFSDEYEMTILNDPWWGGDFTADQTTGQAPMPFGPDDPLALMGGYQDEESYWGYP